MGSGGNPVVRVPRPWADVIVTNDPRRATPTERAGGARGRGRKSAAASGTPQRGVAREKPPGDSPAGGDRPWRAPPKARALRAARDAPGGTKLRGETPQRSEEARRVEGGRVGTCIIENTRRKPPRARYRAITWGATLSIHVECRVPLVCVSGLKESPISAIVLLELSCRDWVDGVFPGGSRAGRADW